MADQKVSWEKQMAALRKASLAKPGAFEDHPWGHDVFKAANKKMFVSTGQEAGVLYVTFKLPHSSEAALTMFGFCSPTGYGLGKSGWVTAKFEKGADVPMDLLLEWLEESYAAVAGAKAAKANAAKKAPVKEESPKGAAAKKATAKPRRSKDN
jgi:predicted DNA-binding protein (MmcQ/YjbR family)